MYALVFWIKSKNFSVINDEELIPNKEENEETSAKYGKDLYRVKVLKKSGERLLIVQKLFIFTNQPIL